MNFDANFLLGKIYFKKQNYMQALVYLKQAYCIDRKSLDVLERLSATLLNLGDFTSAYCCLKRILPLIINNQREYLEILRNLKQLEDSGFWIFAAHEKRKMVGGVKKQPEDFIVLLLRVVRETNEGIMHIKMDN